MEQTKELPLEKTHPYRFLLEKELEFQKYHLTLLENRNKLKPEFNTDWDRNEYDILMVENKGRIAAQKRSIRNKQQHYDEFMKLFAKQLDECNKNYERIINSAKRLQDEIPSVKNYLARVNWEVVKSDVEAKVRLYFDLKAMI